MKVAILIPTIAGREKFLHQAIYQISEQSHQPDIIEIIQDLPIYKSPDVAWRYKIGIQRCKQKGADIIIFWEDDDWYRYNYIEMMVKSWIIAGRPDVFGISRTIYYNIVKRKYLLIDHPGRASMMSTMVTKNFIPQWEDDRDPYIDMFIWRGQYNKATVDVSYGQSITIGIKHGIGACAGGGHFWTDDKFPFDDKDLEFLSKIIDPDSLRFYSSFYGKH